jgi:dienelactone hydrolase
LPTRGEPKGTVTKTSDGKADIYIASPDASNKKDAALLFLPDIFGIYPNSKLLADSFAAQGYTTAVLDLFSGDAPSMPPPANFEIFKWINEGFDGKTPHTTEAIDPIVVEGIKTLKAQGFNKIGAVAYCFGAKVRFPSPDQVIRACLWSGTANI